MSGLFAVLRARAQLVPKSLLPLRGRIDFQVFAAVPNNNFVLIRGETEVDALRLAGEGDVRLHILEHRSHPFRQSSSYALYLRKEFHR